MKESLRRPILFAVIVITGSLLILFDIPLIIMIPIILIVGFGILLILGAITVNEIKNAINPANLKKIGILKKLDEMKFFEKKAKGQADKIQPVKTDAKKPAKDIDKKKGIGQHLDSFVSSIKSLGTLLKERKKRGKKIDDINMQLDKAVHEKVEKGSALASAGDVKNTSGDLPSGGSGISTPNMTSEQDPFLSLSDDEFDAGLLDSLDEFDSQGSKPGISDTPSIPLADASSPEINEPDLSLPSLDIDGEAGNILADNAQGLEEFSGLDGSDSLDSDFADLDSLSLDDVDLDDETDEQAPQPAAASPAPIPESQIGLAKPGKEEVKTEWIKSDAPKNAGQFDDQISTQADMAAFAGGGETDADLLSSLAADVKHVKVEKNLSLLRELKDYKASAAEIEAELNDMYTRIDSVKKTQEKTTTPADGTDGMK